DRASCASAGRFFEAFHAGRVRHPVVRGARPDMPVDLEPACVVERAAGDTTAAGKDFRGPRHRGAAAGAELHAEPAAALVGAEAVWLELAAQQLEILLLEIDADAEGAAGTALARFAVANAGAERVIPHAIAHHAASASPFMQVVIAGGH